MGKASKTVSLNLTFNDKKLTCVGGRVKVSDIFANSNHQTIINRPHSIAKLIIKYYHQNIYVWEESKHPPFFQDFGYQLLVCLFTLFIL